MKKQFIAIALAACFIPLAPQNSRANPAVAVGAAGCAASGVCGVIVGTVVIAGVLCYVINANNGRQYTVQAYGFEVHRQPLARPSRIGNPDEPYHSQIIDYVWGDSEWQAKDRCEQIARQSGLRSAKVRQTSQRGKKWECHVDNL